MRTILALCLTCLALPAGAHPHIYIDTLLRPIFDENGDLAAVRVVWIYDEMYSELVLDEYGLDPERDGLTDAEQDSLTGFDMQWVEGFDGDLKVEQAGRALTLSGPLDPTLFMDTDGQIVTMHLRRFEPAVKMDAPVVLSPYDPSFYSAYSLLTEIKIEGRDDCTGTHVPPDAEAGYELLRKFQEEAMASGATEAEFPAIGGAFADKLELSCPETAGG